MCIVRGILWVVNMRESLDEQNDFLYSIFAKKRACFRPSRTSQVSHSFAKNNVRQYDTVHTARLAQLVRVPI